MSKKHKGGKKGKKGGNKKSQARKVTQVVRAPYNGFDRINSHMYVGGDPMYCEDLLAEREALMDAVDVIFDCRSEEERKGGWDRQSMGIPVIYAPMHDDGHRQNRAGDFIAPYLQLQELISRGVVPNNPVMFAHCHMGVNRGPSMAMFLMMMEHKMTAKEAFLQLRAKRAGVGVAYAEQAIRAFNEMTVSDPFDGGESLTDWHIFQDGYWTEDRNWSVRERVMTNRTNSRIMFDDRGQAHVER